MNMIFTLTLRNLLSNKKRTLLTLLTILLSISMITAILCGGWSLVDFLKEKEKVYGGDYDYYMEDLTWEQVQELYSQNNVGEVSLLRFAGNSFYGEKSNSTMLSVGEIDENFTQRFSLNQYLLAGRFPQDENELVISESFLKKNNMNTEIGDTISLTLGSRIWDEYNAQLSGLTNYRGEEESFVPTKEKAYVVVGILSDVNDSKIAANYNAFAGVDKTARQNMFQRGETIMRIKSMMKGMLAVVMAMSMAACSGAPAADQTSSESPAPAQTESTAATEQETIVTEVSAETQTQEETAKAPKYVFCLLVMV